MSKGVDDRRSRIPVSEPFDRASPIAIVRTMPSATLPQGVATANLPANLSAAIVPPLAQAGRWTCGDPFQSRPVRVQVSSLPGTTSAPATFAPPLIGVMAMVRTQSQNGTKTTTWKAVPCDYVENAMSIEVSVCAVGLPYQAIPQSTISAAAAALTAQVTCSFSERLSDPLPSLPLYPASFAGGTTGSALGAAGVQPLAPTSLGQVQGFLRSLEITNGSAGNIYVVGIDAPANMAAPTAAQMWNFPSWSAFLVPSGTTVEKRFDDRPFFWGPWVGITAAIGSAFVSGASVLVEGSYVAVQPPGV